jgi:HPt (histidine-containing phosphotransfer) domain-containing protein
MLRAALAQEIGALEIGAEDPPALAEQAHRIGGLAAYAGRADIRGAAIEMELAARSGDARRLRARLRRLRTLARGIGPHG